MAPKKQVKKTALKSQQKKGKAKAHGKAQAKATATKAAVTATTLAAHNAATPDGNNLQAKLEHFLETNKKASQIPETDVEKFLSNLNTKEQQSLWKQFEKTRQSAGKDSEYKAVAAGRGSIATSRSLLRSFLADKLRLGQSYTSAVAKVQMNKTSGVKAEWLSLATVQQRHGEDLPRLVRAKAIQVRRHPAAPDVLQFRDHVEYSDTNVQQVKGFEGSCSSDITFAEFQDLYKKCTGGAVTEKDFDELRNGDSDDDRVDDSTIDGLFEKKKNKGAKAILDKVPQKEDKDDKEQMAACSKIGKADGWEQIVLKASTMHSLLMKAVLAMKASKGQLPKNQEWSKTMVKEDVEATSVADKMTKTLEKLVTTPASKGDKETAKKLLLQVV